MVAMLAVALFVVCFLLDVGGLWIFIVIPSFVVGILIDARVRSLAYIGLPALFATLLSVLYNQPSYKLAEAKLVGTLSGIPAGQITFVLLTIIVAFLLASFAGLAGSYASALFQKTETG